MSLSLFLFALARNIYGNPTEKNTQMFSHVGEILDKKNKYKPLYVWRLMNHVLPHVWCGEKSPLWRVMIKPRWQVWQLVTALVGGINFTNIHPSG